MTRAFHTAPSLIRIVDEGTVTTSRELYAAHLFAIRHFDGTYSLVKSRRYPGGKLVTSHFSEPISLATLKRYIHANLV